MTKFSFSFSLLLASISLLSASSGVAADSGLLSPRDHPAGDLFTRKHHHKQQAAKRQSSSTLSFTGTSKNGKPYPEAGDKPPALDTIPQAWIDAYNKAKSDGKIPDIKPSTAPGGIVEYPADQDMTDVCSWTVQKCDTGDIWLAPPGKVGLSFDDGPSLGTPDLLNYMDSKKIDATHFVIGSAILYNPETMKLMADAGVHLGVHTFSHSIQTTKTDMEVLGDLGWTVQLIYEATGKVPMYFRPPEGDVDARVRAIALHVLGLQTVMWNEDADDWCLRNGKGSAKLETCETGTGKSYKSVVKEMKSWAQNDQSKGFISLEHETTDQAVDAFKEYVEALEEAKWSVGNVPQLQDLPWYQNQYGRDDPVEKVDSILPVREPFIVDDSAAAPGSSTAPDASDFKKSVNLIKSSSSSSGTSSNGTGSGASSANSVSGSSISGASQLSFNLFFLGGLGLIAVALA